MKTPAIHNESGRRSGLDRRQFSYAAHIPERRSGKERRTNWDRRTNGQAERSANSNAFS